MASQRYLQLLEDAKDLHRRKSAGYAGDNPDIWVNFREAEGWGITALQGCLVRMGDKYKRVQSLMQNPANEQVGEAMRDTLRDLMAYAGIAVCLLDEETLGREMPE